MEQGCRWGVCQGTDRAALDDYLATVRSAATCGTRGNSTAGQGLPGSPGE